jgi:hypothetical protein
LGVRCRDVTETLGRCDVLLPLQQPHRHALRHRVEHLRKPVQDRLETGGLAFDPSASSDHEDLPELLMSRPAAGALLAHDLLHQLAVDVHVRVGLHLYPAVLGVRSLMALDCRDGPWEPAKPAAALTVASLLRRPSNPRLQLPIAWRQRLVIQVLHRQAKRFHQVSSGSPAAVTVQQHHPAALAVGPPNRQRRRALGMDRATGLQMGGADGANR